MAQNKSFSSSGMKIIQNGSLKTEDKSQNGKAGLDNAKLEFLDQTLAETFKTLDPKNKYNYSAIANRISQVFEQKFKVQFECIIGPIFGAAIYFSNNNFVHVNLPQYGLMMFLYQVVQIKG